MNKKIVLIGAGSAQFGQETVADILLSKVLKGSEICLHDINPRALKTTQIVTSRAVKENNLPFTITATTNRKQALKGADFCVISIEVGYRFGLWEQDWSIPLKYGSRQVFGENGGPGGMFHALRIIPPILAICADAAKICPDAFIFNYSNPMSRICLAVKRKFPQLKFYGLCHEIGSMPHHLPKLLKTPFSNLAIKAGGLNHFTWLLEVKYKKTGKDAYPEVRRKWLNYIKGRPERTMVNAIFQKFGYLPVTTDSHFGEYIHWAKDVADHKGIKNFYRFYKKYCFKRINRLQDILSGKNKDEWWTKFSGERLIPMFEEIITDAHKEELAVNLPNSEPHAPNLLIDNLPKDCVVEVPAMVDKKGVHGVKLGMLSKGIAGLLNHEAAVQDVLVEAAIQGSRDLALQALLVDTNMTSFRKAEQLLDKMIKTQKKYLGYIK
ncbi:MAG: alpha-glucosidase [Planctomycetes bacterium]|nr:alpha-glucosidase [Planctomycetota bacterium]